MSGAGGRSRYAGNAIAMQGLLACPICAGGVSAGDGVLQGSPEHRDRHPLPARQRRWPSRSDWRGLARTDRACQRCHGRADGGSPSPDADFWSVFSCLAAHHAPFPCFLPHGLPFSFSHSPTSIDLCPDVRTTVHCTARSTLKRWEGMSIFAFQVPPDKATNAGAVPCCPPVRRALGHAWLQMWHCLRFNEPGPQVPAVRHCPYRHRMLLAVVAACRGTARQICGLVAHVGGFLACRQ